MASFVHDIWCIARSISWSPFFLAATGGLIGGGFSLLATKAAHRNQMEAEAKRHNRIVVGVLQAVKDEMSIVYSRYMQTIGEKLDKTESGHPFFYITPVENEYFNIYNNNTHLLGHIDSEDVRKTIIRTYTMAKGIIDGLQFNNGLMSQFQIASAEHHKALDAASEQKMKVAYRQLIEFSHSLKSLHESLKVEAKYMDDAIGEYIDTLNLKY